MSHRYQILQSAQRRIVRQGDKKVIIRSKVSNIDNEFHAYKLYLFRNSGKPY